MTTRRQFLAATLALAALRQSARAIGPSSRFRIGQLLLDGAGDFRPSVFKPLLWEIDKRTSIDVEREPVAVPIGSDKLWDLPFLVLRADRAFPPLAKSETARLRRFLVAGGFLLCDAAGSGGTPDGAVRRMCGDVFPRDKLAPLPSDHVLFKSFYLTPPATGRTTTAPFEAVIHDKRAAIVYSPNDLFGALARDELGNWEHECTPGGETQRELAFRSGVNLAMYALCLDYKSDQVHVPFLLRRRPWKPPS